MLRYSGQLKWNARQLRKNMTDSEQVLWECLRRKQVLGVQFYRQKPIGSYIVDFFSPKAKWVIEVDGSRHKTVPEIFRDQHRDEYLANLGLWVIRFNDLEVLQETDGVIEVIFQSLSERLPQKIPPAPPLRKGGQIREKLS